MMLSMPPLARALGYAGLIPFVGLAIAALADPRASGAWQQLLLYYGAVILAFVGALHWGVAMTDRALGERQRNVAYGWSVVPALLAWLSLLLDPAVASALLAAGFGAHLLRDWRLAREAELPAGYLPMRFQLSAVAALCLALSSFSSRI
ncbi:MAG: DUF3429 domain-containing protein [Pseudomonadota bacterium]